MSASLPPEPPTSPPDAALADSPPMDFDDITSPPAVGGAQSDEEATTVRGDSVARSWRDISVFSSSSTTSTEWAWMATVDEDQTSLDPRKIGSMPWVDLIRHTPAVAPASARLAGFPAQQYNDFHRLLQAGYDKYADGRREFGNRPGGPLIMVTIPNHAFPVLIDFHREVALLACADEALEYDARDADVRRTLFNLADCMGMDDWSYSPTTTTRARRAGAQGGGGQGEGYVRWRFVKSEGIEDCEIWEAAKIWGDLQVPPPGFFKQPRMGVTRAPKSQ